MDAAHIHNASKKELFDFVIDHLKKQNGQALGKLGSCVYKSPEGLKCAVGCLFTDIEYDPSMEGMSVFNLLPQNKIPARLEDLFRNNIKMLEGLQYLHDGNAFRNDNAIQDLRNDYGV